MRLCMSIIIIIRKGTVINMDTKSILIAIISFIAGALLVSIAATTFERDRLIEAKYNHESGTVSQEL